MLEVGERNIVRWSGAAVGLDDVAVVAVDVVDVGVVPVVAADDDVLVTVTVWVLLDPHPARPTANAAAISPKRFTRGAYRGWPKGGVG